MTTNVQIISDALREINVLSEVDTATAEQGAHALRRLNNMMEAWTEDGLNLGYFRQTSTTADCPIPFWAEEGVITALAISLAPVYGATASPELIAKFEDTYSRLLRKSINEGLKGRNMDHMPWGSGSFGNTYNITTDR